jgi:hypothetical protein
MSFNVAPLDSVLILLLHCCNNRHDKSNIIILSHILISFIANGKEIADRVSQTLKTRQTASAGRNQIDRQFIITLR